MNIQNTINIEMQQSALRDIEKAIKQLDSACEMFLNISEADINSAQSKKLDEYLTELLSEYCTYLTLDTEALYA